MPGRMTVLPSLPSPDTDMLPRPMHYLYTRGSCLARGGKGLLFKLVVKWKGGRGGGGGRETKNTLDYCEGNKIFLTLISLIFLTISVTST